MPARYGEQGYGQHQYVYSGNERRRQEDKEEEDYGREGLYEETGYGHGGDSQEVGQGFILRFYN